MISGNPSAISEPRLALAKCLLPLLPLTEGVEDLTLAEVRVPVGRWLCARHYPAVAGLLGCANSPDG